MKKQGFTLIEIIIVMSIVSLLLAFILPSFSDANKKGRDGKRKADLKEIQSALEMYRSDTRIYPAVVAGRADVQLAGLVPRYTAKIPPDPLNKGIYYWNHNLASSTTYELCAYLERGIEDKDYNAGACGGSAACYDVSGAGEKECNYEVTNP